MDLSLLFAGTAGSVPSARRGLPAVLLRRGGDRLLVDCGEGTQRQLLRGGGLPDLDAVFLTHFHADHWLGLPGLVKSFGLRDRTKPLVVYGPPGTRQLLDLSRFMIGRLPYPFRVEDVGPDEAIHFDGYAMEPFGVRHRGAAYGWALVEDDRPGRFDPDRARALGVAEGPAFGRLQRGEAVDGVRPEEVVGPDRSGRRIVISGDTSPCEQLNVAADGADLLVHEATFLHADAERAMQTGHSTARQAALLGLEADVGLLALTHLSTRYPPREVLEEARETFERTVLPRDLDHVDVPFAERGDPELVRFEPPRRTDRPPAAGPEDVATEGPAGDAGREAATAGPARDAGPGTTGREAATAGRGARTP